MDFLNPDESRKLLDTVQEHPPRWLSFFLTVLRTGMRVGELIALQWEDIDWNGEFVEVRRVISRGEPGSGEPPGRSELEDHRGENPGKPHSRSTRKKRPAKPIPITY